MKSAEKNHALELEIQIEELELKCAPDGGETVVPLGIIRHPRA